MTSAADKQLSSRALNIITAVVMVALITAGITAEQVFQKDPDAALVREDLPDNHIVNVRPETAEVLPGEFIDKLAICEQTTFDSQGSFSDGAQGYSCLPWLTQEQADDGEVTFHSPRKIFFGDEAQRLYDLLPDYHDEVFDTSTVIVREAGADGPDGAVRPAILVNAWFDDGFGAGDVVVYYPEATIMVTWPWVSSDAGAGTVAEVIDFYGF